jgi:hypothetical protein
MKLIKFVFALWMVVTSAPTLAQYLQADRLDILGRTNDPELLVGAGQGAFRLPDQIKFNHPYGYANQNPVNYFDPTGLSTLTACLNPANVAACSEAGMGATEEGSIVSSGSAGDTGKKCPKDDHCEKMYEIDTDTCGGVSRVRGKAAGAACYASASQRYGACLADKPIPPLNTWNN